MARRARVTVDIVEVGDTISLHFGDGEYPPLWLSMRERPTAHGKLKRILDEEESVEEVPVLGPKDSPPGPGRPGWRAQVVAFPDGASDE